MNTLFQEIGDRINYSAAKEWIDAELLIRVLGGMVRYKLYFQYADGNRKAEFFEEDGSISILLRKLHSEMNTVNPKHWNKLFFKIDNQGKFETLFEWDQALQDEFERDSSI